MAYKWNGSPERADAVEAPALTVAQAPPAKPAPAPVKPGARCGTPTGYKDHKKAGEDACDRCKTALAEYSREYRARVRAGLVIIRKGFSPERCGSYAGYTRHKRYDVPPCDPCLVAHADYMADYRAARKAEAA